MERYESLFAQLNDRKEGAFVPFVTLGDPGVEQSLKIIDALIEAGAGGPGVGAPLLRSVRRWPDHSERHTACICCWRYADPLF